MIKKYIYIILAIPVIFSLITYIKSVKKNKPSDLTNIANNVMDTIGVQSAKRALYNKMALDLANYLGTAYDWYDPRRWTENDKKAFEILNGLPQKDFDIISKLYFEVYAKGRTLLNDLAKFLDSKYYSQLNFV